MTQQPPVIEIKKLNKVFHVGFFRRRVHVVKDLSLVIQPGEIFGFLGPNGAGKTTTLKMLMGLIYPTSGEVKLFGQASSDLRAKARIGFLPEHPYFYEYLTGFEFLDFYGRLFGLSGSIRTVRVERLLELVGLTHAQEIPLRKYSKGMIQRVGIAQALINDPDLIVLDEPMSGLDPMGRKDVRDIIFKLKENGKTVFFSSHILQDVEMVSDRVAILNKGQLQKVGSLRDLLAQNLSHELEFSVSGMSPDARESLRKLETRVIVKGDPLTIAVKEEDLNKAIKIALKHSLTIESIVPFKGTLEDLFLQQVLQGPEEAKK